MLKKHVESGGTTLYYEVHKKGNRPWLILQHGWGSNHSIWHPYVRHFKRKYNILVPDLRCHGKSQEGTITWNHFTKDLHTIIKKEKIAKCILLGHSLGADIAHHFTIKHSKIVKRLILATPSSKQYSAKKFLTTLGYYFLLQFHLHRKRKFQHYWTDDITPSRITLINDFAGTTRKTLTRTFKLLMNYNMNLKKIKCPTFIVKGKNDPLINNKKIKADTNKLKHITCIEIKGPHMITTYARKEFIEALDTIL